MIDKIGLSPKPQGQHAKPGKELVAAARAFEAVFVRQLMSSMRSAKLGDDLFGSSATEQFQEMADGRAADAMAERGSIGIADMLIKQFGKMGASE